MAIVIIPNSLGMFNKNRTFFKKTKPRIRTNYTNFLDTDCADYVVFCHEKAQKRQKNDQKIAFFSHPREDG